MTVTFDLPPNVGRAYLAAAQARGLQLADVVREVVLAAQPLDTVSELSPEEWLRRFTAWSESPAHAHLPDLSDEAMSREAIYADRGL